MLNREPWDGLNPVQASYEVIQNKRMVIPSMVPQPISALMQKCWYANPDDRPDFAEICDITASLM